MVPTDRSYVIVVSHEDGKERASNGGAILRNISKFDSRFVKNSDLDEGDKSRTGGVLMSSEKKNFGPAKSHGCESVRGSFAPPCAFGVENGKV